MQYIGRNRDSFIDQINPFANNIFQHAVMQGDMAIVSLMLKHGTVVRRNERNRHGLTALQQSVLDSNSRLAMRLLESGADLEAKTSNGWTSLHIAAATGDINMVCFLLAHCADVVALTNNDELPIDLAMNVDVKVMLANEMSRCGYIELSQWYMAKMTPQDAGVVYVMSADSLLEIACVSPEQYTADNYVLYQQNALHSYSSMINLRKSSSGDLNKAQKTKTRKGSVWSLSQQSVNQPFPREEAFPRTVTQRNKPDQECNRPPETEWMNTNDHVPKSFSSGYLSETADTCNLCAKPDGNMATGPASMETELPNDDSTYTDPNSSVLISNVTDTGTMRRIRRKTSVKRKDSESTAIYYGDWVDEANRPVQVNIDYFYQASMDHEENFEEDDEYIEFNTSRRQRVGSSASESSSVGRRSVYVSSSGSLIEYSDVNVYSGDKTLLSEFADNAENNDEDALPHFEMQHVDMSDHANEADANFGKENVEVQSRFAECQVVSQYNAVPSTVLEPSGTNSDVQFESNQYIEPDMNNSDRQMRVDRMSGQSQKSSGSGASNASIGARLPARFEIDTDNIDDLQDARTEVEYSEQKPRSKSMPDLDDDDDDEEAFKETNMYFNPMYKSVDTSSSDSPEKQQRENPRDPRETAREYYDVLRESRADDSGREVVDIMKQNSASQVKERSRELYRNEDDFKDVKRKKRGLLSELVSKFKGTVKLHRTSSDADLQSGDEGAVVKRNSGKTKSLRRRRHVRRSNSFSSYFPPVSDKHGSQANSGERSIQKGTQGDHVYIDSARNENNPMETRPYSTHRKDRSPLSPLSQRKLDDNRQESNRVSSTQRKDKNMQNHFMSNGKMNGKVHMANGFSEALYNNRTGDYVDKGESRIPRRSVNTYSKGISVMNDCPKQQENGCMSMKFLCK